MQLLQHFKELTVHPKNAEELKGLILQLAIQGKLTKKWREERKVSGVEIEPASVLLDKIRAEKARLVHQNKIKKDKVLPQINEEETPFSLPARWCWEKLANISSINGGFAFKSSQYVEDGVRVIRISDFDEKGFKNEKIVRYDYSSDLADYRLEEKNILMAMTGGTVGKTYFVKSLEEEMVVNQRVATIKVIPILSEEYINYVIQTSLVKDVVEEAKNSTNDNISMGDIKNFFIPLPPLEEQKAIVEIVNQLFKEIEALEEKTNARVKLKEDFVASVLHQITTRDTTEQWSFLQDQFKTFFTEKRSVQKLRESILQLAVQGKLTRHWREQRTLSGAESEDASILLERIKKEKAKLIAEKKIKKENPLPEIMEDEIPYELPEGWVWCRLRDLTELITKGSSPKWQGVQYVDEGQGILFITSENVGAYNLILSKKKYVESRFNEIEPRSILCKNDILMNIVGGSIGRTAIYGIDEVANINQAVTIIRLLDLNHQYFLHFFNSPTCLAYMFDKQVDNARPNLSMGNIAKFLIPLPAIAEQKAIVQKVDALMDLCDCLEQEIETGTTQIEQLMQSCLREVFLLAEEPEVGKVKQKNREEVRMAAESKIEYLTTSDNK